MRFSLVVILIAIYCWPAIAEDDSFLVYQSTLSSILGPKSAPLVSSPGNEAVLRSGQYISTARVNFNEFPIYGTNGFYQPSFAMMRTDCEFVLYTGTPFDTSHPAWSSKTKNLGTNCTLKLGTDGSLAVINSAGIRAPITDPEGASGTYLLSLSSTFLRPPYPPVQLAIEEGPTACGGQTMWSSQTGYASHFSGCIMTGQIIRSSNQKYYAMMEDGCNFVEYLGRVGDTTHPVWSTGTAGKGQNCTLQFANVKYTWRGPATSNLVTGDVQIVDGNVTPRIGHAIVLDARWQCAQWTTPGVPSPGRPVYPPPGPTLLSFADDGSIYVAENSVFFKGGFRNCWSLTSSIP